MMPGWTPYPEARMRAMRGSENGTAWDCAAASLRHVVEAAGNLWSGQIRSDRMMLL